MKRKENKFNVPNGDVELAKQFYAVMMGGGLLDFGKGDTNRTKAECPSKAQESEFGGAINNLQNAIRTARERNSEMV